MRCHTILALTLSFFLFGSGCEIIGPDKEDSLGLASHRAEWNSSNDGTYSFVLFRGCFCVWSGTIRIQVVENEIVSAFMTERNEEVPYIDLGDLETIDDIFDMIERAEGRADLLEVTWSDRGYPAEVSIDWTEEIADDEMYVTISEVSPWINED